LGRSRHSVRCGLHGALALAIVSFASAALGQSGDLTLDERAAVDRGDLVARPLRETRDGRLWIGGVSYQRMARPRDEVWRAIHDVAHWRDMLPAATETRVEDAGTHEHLVEVHQAYGPMQARYTLRVHFDDGAHRCSFALEADRPHDIRDGRGLLEVHRVGGAPHASILVFAVRADPGDGFLMPLVLDSLETWSLRVPSTVRAYLEGEGAQRYGD
jgi:hypothetical protein